MARKTYHSIHSYKRIHINPETRRMTLPEPFYDALRLDDEIMLAQVGDYIVMRSPEEMVETETSVLEAIIDDGFEGQDIVREFAYRKARQEERLRQEVLRQEQEETSQLSIDL